MKLQRLFVHLSKVVKYSTMPSRFLNQKQAAAFDQSLFTDYQYSVDQLMELAGLACAQAISKAYPDNRRTLILCGPGNNGGDGLVAARHLQQFGYTASVHCPVEPKTELMMRLRHQVISNSIPCLPSMPTVDQLNTSFDLIVDALFGFSFRPPVRSPYDEVLRRVTACNTKVASVDVPTGWHVENGPMGDDESLVLQPDMLISLTAPKPCALHFKGSHHYIGGRFVPPALAKEFDLELPDYPDCQGVVEVGREYLKM